VPWNLADNSENLTLWGSYAVSGTITKTANYATAPNGTMTATRIQNSGGTTVQWTYQDINLINGGTISMYVKRNGSTNQTFRLFGNNGAENSANFTATSEWQRFEFAILPSGSTKPQGITTDSSGNAADILVWGGQLNIGSTAKPYFPTTDRLNVPRLTYQNGGGGCPSLLLEKQSTNLFAQSNTFTSVGDWYIYKDSGSTFTQTSNYGISPDGTQNATRLQASITAGVYANYARYFTVTIGTTYTYSIYIKSLSGTPTIRFVTPNGSAQSITLTTNWERYTYTFTASSADFYGNFYIESPTSSSYDLLTYGAQLEASSYPTSYIPTTSASATRVADVINTTGKSALIGQTQGVIFADVVTTSGDSDYVTILQLFGDYSNRLAIGLQVGTTNLFGYLNAGGGGQFFNVSTQSAGRHKIAFAYKSGEMALYINGVSAFTSTSTFTFGVTLDTIFMNNLNATAEIGSFKVNESVIFKTRLTNSELASLTTL
jgi:hypothetical protein